MASNPENVRLTVLMKLQEAIDEEAILEEQILALMHRFADRFTDRRVEINNLMVLHDHALVDYGKYALGCMTGADMKKCVYLKSVRDELLRSMEEKRQLMANYRDIDDGWVEGDTVGGVVISVVATVGEVGCVGMVGGVGVKGVGDSSGGCVVVAGK
ncbi:hypothetical protein Tco_0222401 [Tanacetum coccineum]